MLAHADRPGIIPPPPSDARRASREERLAMLRWTAIIIGFLGGGVGMWIYAAILAVSDPSMAVVPDYHEKALQWDKQVKINADSRALGWTVHPVAGPLDSTNGKRVLTLFLRDAQSAPIVGAVGELRLYHHARAGQAQTVSLKETAPGSYEATVDMQRTGTWQLEVKLDRESDHYEWNAAQDFESLP